MSLAVVLALVGVLASAPTMSAEPAPTPGCVFSGGAFICGGQPAPAPVAPGGSEGPESSAEPTSGAPDPSPTAGPTPDETPTPSPSVAETQTPEASPSPSAAVESDAASATGVWVIVGLAVAAATVVGVAGWLRGRLERDVPGD